MTWAAYRQTTRTEDMAYCLLGIFDINMPLPYGEGMKAFQRLQKEIIETSSDLSIFAWKDSRRIDPKSVGPRKHFYRGFLASCPQEFEAYSRLKFEARAGPSTPHLITNHGVSIRLNLREVDKRDQLYVVDLNIVHSYGRSVGIYLKRLSKKGDQFARVCTGVLPVIEDAFAEYALIGYALIGTLSPGPFSSSTLL